MAQREEPQPAASISPGGNVALGRLLAPSGAGALTPALIRSLQRSAGNASVQALANRLRAPLTVQRDPAAAPPAPAAPAAQPLADVPVTDVDVNAARVTIPTSAALRATARPANATDVAFGVANETVDPTNVKIDAKTGVIAIAAGQQGGQIRVTATSKDGSMAYVTMQIVEKPMAITATAASGADNYGGQFVHTFSAPSGKSSGLEGANINETFALKSAPMPWGGNFTLISNAAGSAGWDLDAAGKMNGPDNVDIPAADVDVGPFVKSASNPTPKAALPQGFTLTQSLHAKTYPGGAMDAAAFTTVPHKRTLVAGPKFEVEAGPFGKVPEDYSGPAAVSKATAAPATVMASPPKPASGQWKQNTVTVSADIVPATASKTYSITGKDLDCTVDASGKVSIGSTAGSITVRVAGSDKNYDEVSITITQYKAPAAPAQPPKGSAAGSGDAGAAPEADAGGG